MANDKTTLVILTCNVKNKDGKVEAADHKMPLAQAKNIFANPKRDKSWKIKKDEKFKLSASGDIIPT